ncbi:MAG: YabP/YqfC family sporulation protein [Oscillospiraceae bacterium]|nr:YabP/YqfC family sporulation protein [Oscillospiraceae bacterium]
MVNLLERIAKLTDLPADTVAGVPKIVLSGDCRAVVENHRGLLQYTESVITAAGGRCTVRIRGEGLTLRAMDRRVLVVSGKIFGVDME